MKQQMTLADGSDEYMRFVEKFKTKKTTDDCYTPENVYEAVANFVAEEYEIDRAAMVRPFWPGGDYERYEYHDGFCVVDNPPFSIISRIVRFYNENRIRYFLFAPYLTNFSIRNTSHIIVDASVTYENGAVVGTSFVTNLDNCAARSCPKLNRAVAEADRKNRDKQRKQLPKYVYPNEVLTAPSLGRMAKLGIEFSVLPTDSTRITELEAQKGFQKSIFGGGLLLSERAAAERAAAEVWELSEREMDMVKMMPCETSETKWRKVWDV